MGAARIRLCSSFVSPDGDPEAQRALNEVEANAQNSASAGLALHGGASKTIPA
jgi:hypothetical protein